VASRPLSMWRAVDDCPLPIRRFSRNSTAHVGATVASISIQLNANGSADHFRRVGELATACGDNAPTTPSPATVVFVHKTGQTGAGAGGSWPGRIRIADGGAHAQSREPSQCSSSRCFRVRVGRAAGQTNRRRIHGTD